MSRTLELPDDVYSALERAALEEGLSPGEWVAAQLPGRQASADGRSLSEILQDVVGAIDSTADHLPAHRSAYGDALSAKFEKQGLRRP
jgi:hypothetical protein